MIKTNDRILEKRVLVSGGAGFIGSHLCQSLVREECDVLCVDNFYSSTKDNIIHLIHDPNFELIWHDVSYPLFFEVNKIYNLACPASPVHYQRDPVQRMKTSVLGAINMRGLSKRTGAQIFQASTSEVYGGPNCSPSTRDLLGECEPNRHSVMLWRGQTLGNPSLFKVFLGRIHAAT